MTWTNSKIFQAVVESVFNKSATALDADADAFKAALFNDTPTPDRTVTAANSCYGAGVWAANQVTDTGSSAPAGWPTVGRPLVTPTSAAAAGVYKFDAEDTASANAVTTLTNAYGTLVYDDTAASPADQGFCYCYFGGEASVTLGSFTIVWATAGIMTITV